MSFSLGKISTNESPQGLGLTVQYRNSCGVGEKGEGGVRELTLFYTISRRERNCRIYDILIQRTYIKLWIQKSTHPTDSAILFLGPVL